MKLSKEQRSEILELRETTKLNLASIAEIIGTSRTSIQRICEHAGLGNIGLRGKVQPRKKKRKPKMTSPTLSPQESALRFRIRLYKGSAKRRGLTFELTDKMCARLFSGNCYYCGVEPELTATYTRRRDVIPVAQNGIDRKDANKGYTEENCVSSCSTCNLAKGKMNSIEFTNWLKRICEFQSREGEENERN